MQYQKTPLTYDQQLKRLQQRGLAINDPKSALNYLRHISYYRLSAYYVPFKTGDRFKEKANFEDVIALCLFDRKLRLLVLEAIEFIEIALRTHLVYHLSHTYGAFGHLNPKNFNPRFEHAEWLETLQQNIRGSTETFITHYKQKYTSSPHLPLWMALEVSSFGGLSRLFKGLFGKDQQFIAKQFDLRDKVLSSWLHILVYIRSLCAHHARLWNRILTFKPLLPKNSHHWHEIANNRIFSIFTILQYCLRQLKIGSSWPTSLISLLNANRNISLEIMGFPKNWQKQPLWNLSNASYTTGVTLVTAE